MGLISTDTDRENLTLTVVAEFDTDVERLWRIWEDPRQLEKWWGPPGWPATFEKHEFEPGGESVYRMTGPDGAASNGHWKFVAIEGPNRIELDDSFADEQGNPVGDMPATRMEVTIEEAGGKARMTTVSRFASVEDLDKVLEMGILEGIKGSVGQIDALL